MGKDGNIGNPPLPSPPPLRLTVFCELHQHCGVRVCNLHIVSRNQDSNCSVCSGGFRSHCPLFLRSVFVPGVRPVSRSPFSGTRSGSRPPWVPRAAVLSRESVRSRLAGPAPWRLSPRDPAARPLASRVAAEKPQAGPDFFPLVKVSRSVCLVGEVPELSKGTPPSGPPWNVACSLRLPWVCI